MNKLLGYPRMLEEAKQSRRKGHSWILEILIFLLVFLIASSAESIPYSFASSFSVIPEIMEKIDHLMYVLQNEGFMAYYQAIMDILMNSSDAAWLSIVSLFCTAAATVIAILYCTKIEKRSAASMGFRKKNFFLEYLGGAAVGIVTISLACVIGILSGTYSFTIAEPKLWWLLLLLIGFAIQGMSEEVLCRGYLMVSMSRKTPAVLCAVLTSVMFALMHFANPGFGLLPFINLTLSGLSFAFYIIKRGNIWGACAMHSFWNFYQGPIFGISVSGTGCTEHAVFHATVSSAENMNIWTGGAFGIEGGLCVTIVEVLTLLFVLFVLPKSKNEQFVPVTAADPSPSEGAVFGTAVFAGAACVEAVPAETSGAAAEEAIPAAEPAPAAEESVPAAEEPALAAEEAVPAAEPAPLAEETIPAAEPAPLAEETIPAAEPAPTAENTAEVTVDVTQTAQEPEKKDPPADPVV